MMSPLIEMQRAVDIVNTSLHPTNKIAATIFSDDFSISKTNYWPESILNAFGCDTDIGNSSGTLHAEIACILAAPITESASICITDPLCPNCAKNIAEAGIKTLYIDHKGFAKDFAARRFSHFENMSMQICEHAGISVYKIHRKEEKLIPILEIPASYTPPNDSPVIIIPIDRINNAIFAGVIAEAQKNMAGNDFAVSLGHDQAGRKIALCARSHLSIGFSEHIQTAGAEAEDTGKYSFTLEPVNRILMNAARLGISLDRHYLYASTPPTARELVNLVGAGFKTLHIGDHEKTDDPEALRAIRQLVEKDILKVF